MACARADHHHQHLRVQPSAAAHRVRQNAGHDRGQGHSRCPLTIAGEQGGDRTRARADRTPVASDRGEVSARSGSERHRVVRMGFDDRRVGMDTPCRGPLRFRPQPRRGGVSANGNRLSLSMMCPSCIRRLKPPSRERRLLRRISRPALGSQRPLDRRQGRGHTGRDRQGALGGRRLLRDHRPQAAGGPTACAKRNLEARLGEIREEARTLEILNRTGAALASELSLERLVQMVTDFRCRTVGRSIRCFLL